LININAQASPQVQYGRFSHILGEVYMFKNILLATDGSDASQHAADLAVALARVHGAKITALYVVDPYPYLGIGEANPYGFQAYMAAALEHGTQATSRVVDMAGAGEAKVEITPRIVEEVTSYRGIVDTAKTEGCDLIVVGSHGRTGVSRVLMGSVADKVVAHALVPVLVVR